ncbi:MAG: ATP-binding protein [Nanoarchaeota archaeon]|nr:ATP-binding protein [Nanoarchaeota archaeon]
MEKCSIDKDELERFKGYFRGYIDQSGLVDAVRKIDGKFSYFTPQEAMLCDVFTDVLSTYESFRSTIKKHVFQNEKSPESEEFMNLYSFYVSLVEGMELLEKHFKSIEKSDLDFGFSSFDMARLAASYSNSEQYKLSISGPQAKGVGYLTHEYKRILNNVSKDRSITLESVIGITKDYFDKLSTEVRGQLEKDSFKRPLEKVSGVNIQVNDITMSGLKYFGLMVSDFGVPQIKFSEVVGNKEIKYKLRDLAIKLLQYDPEARQNPNSVPSTYLLVGEPGGGKTMLVQALYNFMLDNSVHPDDPKKSKKVRFLELDAGCFSKWRGETEEKVGKLFDMLEDKSYITVMLIDDIDTILANREDSSENQADIKTTGYIMKRLEGFKSSNAGNFLVISTSNKDHSLDDAVRPRIAQLSDVVPGVKDNYEISSLVQNMLKNDLKDDYSAVVNINEFNEIADSLAGYNLSGRDIRNIVKGIVAESTSLVNGSVKYDSSEDILPDNQRKSLFLAHDKIKENNRRFYGQICSVNFLDAITKYVADTKKQKQVSKQKRIELEAEMIDIKHRALGHAALQLDDGSETDTDLKHVG